MGQGQVSDQSGVASKQYVVVPGQHCQQLESGSSNYVSYKLCNSPVHKHHTKQVLARVCNLSLLFFLLLYFMLLTVSSDLDLT